MHVILHFDLAFLCRIPPTAVSAEESGSAIKGIKATSTMFIANSHEQACLVCYIDSVRYTKLIPNIVLPIYLARALRACNHALALAPSPGLALRRRVGW